MHDTNNARTMFRRFYPEKNVHIYSIKEISGDKTLIEAKFPDGIFYFIVHGNTVSPSYDTENEALRHV